ncbi:diguanylate cyclase domain-containing protein [Streptomyces anulatus]|uniref:diguanylate cyclase domain-containing protein n=1 Tax=Streptomyces anulatus TaxID=1892 RepID=UPI0038691835
MCHAVGDTVLAAYGSRLTAWAGPRAAVGRLGGDEFAFVLNADRRERRLEQLVRMLHTPVVLDGGRTVDVAASVSSGQRSGVLKPGGLNIRIKDFVSWVNREVATHNPASQLIPDDPHGPSWPAAYEGPWPGTSPAAPEAWSHSPSSTATWAPSWMPAPSAATAPAAAAAFTPSSTSKPLWPQQTTPPACKTGSSPANASQDPPPAEPSPPPPTSPASRAASSRALSYTRPAPTSPATASCSTTTPRPC